MNYKADRALYTDVDPNNPNTTGGRVLEEGDSAANYLLVGKDCEIDEKTAKRFGLPESAHSIGGPVVEAVPDDIEKPADTNGASVSVPTMADESVPSGFGTTSAPESKKASTSP